jgi:hypothetical protein
LETDGQCDSCNGSSGLPSALLQISYSTGNLQHNILQYYFGTGEDDTKPGLIPGDTLQNLNSIYFRASERILTHVFSFQTVPKIILFDFYDHPELR